MERDISFRPDKEIICSFDDFYSFDWFFYVYFKSIDNLQLLIAY